MPSNLQKHHRRSIRLKGYNYAQAGTYFVTVCTKNHECLFGDVVDGRMVLNAFGETIESEWLQTPEIRPNVELN
jgi:putative transposase